MKYIIRSIWFFTIVLLGVSLFSSNVKAAVPNSPSRLKAMGTCVPIADRQGVLRLRTATELVWQDRSDDETGFEIYSQGQVDEEEQPFLLDGTVDPNVREYDDHNFIMSTGYKIRAINSDGSSDYTEEFILSPHCEEGLGYHDVILSPALFSLEVGQTKQLHGYIMEGNEIKDNFLARTTNCVWNSSNNQVVTVDSNGLVTAVRALGLRESMPSISVNCNVDVFAITDMLQSAYVFVQNRRPIANDQSVLVNKNSGGKFITLTGIDSDGDTLACSIVSSPTHGTLDGTGCYKTYTPTRNYTGDDSFTFKVNDGIQDSVASTVSITVTEPPPPVPTLNSATALCIDSKDPGISLSWTDVSGEDNYEVWRSTTLNGTYSKVASPAQNATSYPDSGLTAATTYYYYVRAVNVAGESDSGKKNATALACLPTLDVRPNSPSVSVGNTTQLNAYWDKDGVDSTFSEISVTSDLNTSWNSSDISKATVSSGGSVAGVAAGSSIITASYNPSGTNRDASGSETVTVSALPVLTITKSGDGTGTVASFPAGIDCGADCFESYTHGTSVTLTATPISGTFAGWSGNADCSDGSVTMDADKTCIATFTAPGGCNPADNAPTVPATPSPADGATGVTPNYMTLDWANSTDIDVDSGCDSIKYDTYAKNEPGDSWTKICTDTSESSCASMDARLENHTYYWYVTAKDTGGHSTDGPEWNFTTGIRAPVPDFKLMLTSPVGSIYPANILIEPTNGAARDLVSTYRGDFYGPFAGPINSFTGRIRDCGTKSKFGNWYTQCISPGGFTYIGEQANFVPGAITSNGGTTDITLSGNSSYYDILDANRGAWIDFVFCGNGAGVGLRCGNFSLPFKINEKPRPDFTPSVAENIVSIADSGSYDPDAADVWLDVLNFRGGGKEMIILAVEFDGSIGPPITRDKFDKCYSPVVSADDLLVYCDVVEANPPTAETPWTYTYGASGDYTIAYAIWDSLLGKGIKTKAVTIAPLEQFTLTVTDPGVSGNISGSGINCGNGGAVCSKDYTNSAEVTLTATPNTGAGYSAGSWSGDCGAGDTGINCSLTMDADKTAGANFTAPGNKTLTITDPGVGGRITSADNFINCGNGGTDCSEIYAHNTPVTLTATPNTGAGYSAGNWSGACGTGGTGTNCSLIMDADKTAGATFTAPGNKTLTITKAGTGIGTVTSVPEGIDCGADCSKSYSFGASVTLTAAPIGSNFIGWSGEGCSGTGACVVTMDAARNVTATFTALPAEADIKANDLDAITVPYNSAVTIEWCGADAHPCANAVSCKVGTLPGGSDISLVATSSNPSYITPALTADTTYFLECANSAGDTSYDNVKITVSAQAAYILTVTKTGAGSGVITSPPPPPRINCQASCASDSASFTSGASVTLTADPTIGSAFAGWSGDADCSDGNLTMDAAKTCTATFNTRPAAINLLAPNWSFAQASQLGALKAFLKWQFSDSNLNPGESAYQLIADDDADKADPLIDTGKCSGYNNPDAKCRINLGVDKYPLHEQISLAYGQKYYWWVKVWNNLGLESSLKQYDTVPDTDNDDGDPLTFTTYKHEFPLVDFSWTPANPSRGEKVKFTDASKYYTSVSPSSPTNCNGGHCAYLWIVPADATIDNASAQNPQITFNSSGRQSVTLKVTDDDGYFTSLTKTLNLRQKLPSWREVKPE